LLWLWQDQRVHNPEFISPIKPWCKVFENVSAYEDDTEADMCLQNKEKEYVNISGSHRHMGG